MKKKSLKRWLILIIPIAIGIVVYNYIYQDHRDIETEKPEFTLSSNELINQFSSDAASAEKKYLNKTIEITGVITEINNDNVIVNASVFCQFQNAIPNTLKSGDNINVKGRCIGYDDLLEEIKLDQCSINSKIKP